MDGVLYSQSGPKHRPIEIGGYSAFSGKAVLHSTNWLSCFYRKLKSQLEDVFHKPSLLGGRILYPSSRSRTYHFSIVSFGIPLFLNHFMKGEKSANDGEPFP